jgi:sugar/nucleoside kinase (ribokinase family)
MHPKLFLKILKFGFTLTCPKIAESPKGLFGPLGVKRALGGAPTNVAVGVSRLGGNAAIIGKVGNNKFGHMLAEVLQSNCVNTKGIHAHTA